LGEVRVDYEEELMLCVFESFCMEYEPEYDAFIFEDQCDDSLHASILASPFSIFLSSNEAPPGVPSSSSHELKPLPNTLEYAFLNSNKTFPMLLANDLNLDQKSQVLDFLRENKEALDGL